MVFRTKSSSINEMRNHLFFLAATLAVGSLCHAATKQEAPLGSGEHICDEATIRTIGKFLRGRKQAGLGHRGAFLAQLLFNRALLFRDLLLADFELAFQVGPAHPALQNPKTERDHGATHAEDALPNEMNRSQARHQDQTGQIKTEQDDDRAFAEKEAKEMPADDIADPSTRSPNLKSDPPVAQKPVLQMKQARP